MAECCSFVSSRDNFTENRSHSYPQEVDSRRSVVDVSIPAIWVCVVRFRYQQIEKWDADIIANGPDLVTESDVLAHTAMNKSGHLDVPLLRAGDGSCVIGFQAFRDCRYHDRDSQSSVKLHEHSRCRRFKSRLNADRGMQTRLRHRIQRSVSPMRQFAEDSAGERHVLDRLSIVSWCVHKHVPKI